MACALAVDLQRRDVERVLRDPDRQVLLERAVEPGVERIRLGGVGSKFAPRRFRSRGARPMIARSAASRLSRSFRALISCATIWSGKFACASFVSVIVATPTSKLRFACASCSDTAAFCATASSTLNCASSTSK